MAVELAGARRLALQLAPPYACVANRRAEGEFIPVQLAVGRGPGVTTVHHWRRETHTRWMLSAQSADRANVVEGTVVTL